MNKYQELKTTLNRNMGEIEKRTNKVISSGITIILLSFCFIILTILDYTTNIKDLGTLFLLLGLTLLIFLTLFLEEKFKLNKLKKEKLDDFIYVAEEIMGCKK